MENSCGTPQNPGIDRGKGVANVARPPRLQWAASLECGEPTIDSQHRELYELGNALLEAAAGGGEDLLPCLDRLIEHVVRHFAAEEAILGRVAYAGLHQHRLLHQQLRAMAVVLRENAIAGDITPEDVVEFVVDKVVAGHLLTADREFMPLFRG